MLADLANDAHSPRGRTRRGITAPELLVVVLIAGLVVLFVIVGLTRQRESARFAGCQRNLMQIGVGLVLYDQSAGQLPTVPAPLGLEAVPRSGPLMALLDRLALPDLSELSDPKSPPKGRPGLEPAERPIGGFLCGSDPHARAGPFPAPVSYRAATGDDPAGTNGAFAVGRRISLAEVEARDGTSFTAAFAERLVGDGRNGNPATAGYALVPGPIGPAGCPQADPASWRGDAGSSWASAGWRSTLYNHALTPGAAPSCLADDGRTALIGASSGHVRGVNLLIFDGGVRTFTGRVDPKIWREWARLGEPETTSP